MASTLPLPETLGDRIRYIREFLSPLESQEDLAEAVTALGVRLSRFQVNQIEMGKLKPSGLAVLGMARALGVSPEDLGIDMKDYPELEFIRNRATMELLQAMGWFRESRSDLRGRVAKVG